MYQNTPTMPIASPGGGTQENTWQIKSQKGHGPFLQSVLHRNSLLIKKILKHRIAFGFEPMF